MVRKLKASYITESYSDVTGEYSRRCEEAVVVLDEEHVGARVFGEESGWCDSLAGAVCIDRLTDDGVVLASSGYEHFTVHAGEPYETGVDTRDGDHSWQYVFEITNE